MALVRETRHTNTTTGETYLSVVRFDMFNDDGYAFLVKANYSRVFSGIRLPPDFTIMEFGRLYMLQAYIQQGSNMLVIRKRRGMTAMDSDDILDAVRMKQGGPARAFIKKLQDKGVIRVINFVDEHRKKQTQYYFNPIYFHNGKRINLTLYNLFKSSIDPFIAQWVKEEYERLNVTQKELPDGIVTIAEPEAGD